MQEGPLFLAFRIPLERGAPPGGLSAGPLTTLWLWLAFAAAMFVLAALVWRSRRERQRSRLSGPGMTVVTLMLSCFVGEVVVRVADKVQHGIPLLATAADFGDADLGWKGHEVFGNLATTKFKVLVLGDSITLGAGVPEDRLYYSVLARGVGADSFAFSGAGYGTLQEYLALDRYLDRIHPDLVIVQVCSNDIINNSWELEGQSLLNNNLMVRPYLVDGRIEYRFPSVLGRMRPFLLAHSRFLDTIVTRAEKAEAALAERGILWTVEHSIRRQGVEFAPFRRAAATSEAIVRLFKERLGPTPLIALAAEDSGRSVEQLRNAFQRNGIPFVDEPARRIRQLAAAGQTLTLDGHHWNVEGHRICGEALAEALDHLGYCRDPRLSCRRRDRPDAGHGEYP